MTPPVPGGTGRVRSAEELVQVARRRGAQIRRRRRVGVGAVAACVAGAVAAVLLTFLPGPTKQKIDVAGTPSGPNQPAQGVIPWTDTPARRPAPAPTPTPPAPSYPARSASQLRASAGGRGLPLRAT